ncbi:MAG: D-2-hydroxyacid dehydrogenase [Planctomycetota bacterium]
MSEPLRIVVLDGYTTSPADAQGVAPEGEPTWDGLRDLGGVTVYPRSADADVLDRIGQAECVIGNKVRFTAERFERLPNLRYLGLMSTGTDAIDLDAAGRSGVVVTNIPGYSTASVAQHVWAMALALVGKMPEAARAVRDGGWLTSPDFCFAVGRWHELEGKTLGVVGLGDIGLRVAQIGAALGMRVLVHSRTPKDVGLEVEWVGVDEVFAQADVLSLHCPLTEQTRGLVNADRLARMKPTAVLINTARGALVDERALAEALAAGRIAGAGLDVLAQEPPGVDCPLLGAPNCLITPHLAWASVEARHRLMGVLTANLRAWREGVAQNVVSPRASEPKAGS